MQFRVKQRDGPARIGELIGRGVVVGPVGEIDTVEGLGPFVILGNMTDFAGFNSGISASSPGVLAIRR